MKFGDSLMKPTLYRGIHRWISRQRAFGQDRCLALYGGTIRFCHLHLQSQGDRRRTLVCIHNPLIQKHTRNKNRNVPVEPRCKSIPFIKALYKSTKVLDLKEYFSIDAKRV